MDHLAGIDRANHAAQPHGVGDLDKGDRGIISAHVLVAAEGDAAADTVAAGLGWVPAGTLGRRLDHRDGAGIVQMPQPEFNGIDLHHGGKLIHEAFDRKYVGMGAE